MADVFGTVASGFEGVRDGFARAQAADPGGAQLCVYRDGKAVVDLWTGRDPVSGRDFRPDTLTCLASSTKGLAATCAHILRERGLIDFDAPVAAYWPEFAAEGKDAITVRQLAAHTAGLLGFPPEDIDPLTFPPKNGMDSDMLNWDACVTSLANMRPVFEPGTAYFYHAQTFGYLIGEVVRRVSGKSIGTFFHDEVAAPLGLDLWIGLPAEQEHRVAPQFQSTGETTGAERRQAIVRFFESRGIDTSLPVVQTFLNSVNGDKELNARLNSREGHAAEMPGSNGIGNARSLAKMYAALIGEVDGIRLLNPQTLRQALQPHTDNLNYPWPLSELTGVQRQRFTLGYQLTRPAVPMLGPGSFGHGGGGGRLGFAHVPSGTAFAYTCNNLLWEHDKGPDARWIPLTEQLTKCLQDAR